MNEYILYITDNSALVICADCWYIKNNCLYFETDRKLVAIFNTNNILGMCENKVSCRKM